MSNIAWQAGEDAAALPLLAEAGISGIEVAPTRLWPGWQGADIAAATAARAALAEAGFVVPALQSLLYGRPDLRVFGDAASRRALLDHLAAVSALAAALGAGALVFGSPGNRDRGALSPAEAMAQAAELFAEAAVACAEAGVCLCLEPNPAAYGCNFLTRWQEAAELVARVGHPGLGLHLDTACIHLAGDAPEAAIRACAGTIRHFHASEPQLGDFAAPAIDHAAAAAALRETGYSGWVSIEMRRQEPALPAIAQAARAVRAVYG